MDDSLFVCVECLTDEYLKNELEIRAFSQYDCSYCGEKNASPLSVLCEYIGEAIYTYYTDPAEELPYESREGGYQGVLKHVFDLVQEMDIWTENNDLLMDVAEYFVGEELCRRNYYSLPREQILSFGWSGFAHKTKHETRYLFFSDDRYHHEEIHPSDILGELGNLFNEFELYRSLPSGLSFVRARVVSKAEKPDTADLLGSAPEDKANIPNRMSAAGISMFYAGFDDATAVLETYMPELDDGSKHIALAKFVSEIDLVMLDFTKLPKIPSIFDTSRMRERASLLFLHDLVADFTKPIARDEKSHVEYVPTQIVTEYVRLRLKDSKGQKIDGIIYPSSRSKNSEAVVIFANNEECQSNAYSGKQILKLHGVKFSDPTEYSYLFVNQTKTK